MPRESTLDPVTRNLSLRFNGDEDVTKARVHSDDDGDVYLSLRRGSLSFYLWVDATGARLLADTLNAAATEAEKAIRDKARGRK